MPYNAPQNEIPQEIDLQQRCMASCLGQKRDGIINRIVRTLSVQDPAQAVEKPVSAGKDLKLLSRPGHCMTGYDSVLCRDQAAVTGKPQEERSMSGYEDATNGNGPAGLEVDGGAVKQPLKPKASGKGDLSSPSYDRNSMVRHCACDPAGVAWESMNTRSVPCCALTAFKCIMCKAITMLLLCLLTVHCPAKSHDPFPAQSKQLHWEPCDGHNLLNYTAVQCYLTNANHVKKRRACWHTRHSGCCVYLLSTSPGPH